VDKVALSTAAIYGLRDDNNLVGQQYSWLGSILSLGSLVGMFPSSWLIHKFPSAKYLCSCSIGWSIMALLMPACSNFGGLMALRFLMGAFEAIIVPGISLLIAGWYKKSEQPPRNAFVFAAMSSVVNGFLSWAVGNIPDSAPLATWQYLYIIVGSISMSWSIFAFIYLPDTPMNAKFLTKQEKIFWVQRLAGNKTGVVNKTWKWDQALEALIDPKTWIIFFFNIAINIPNGGLITFNGIIIKNLGFNSKESSLLAMPTGVMSTLASILFSYLAAKWNNRRCLVTMIACMVPIVGTAILYGVHRSAVAAQLVGLYFVSSFRRLCFLQVLTTELVLYILRAICRRHLPCTSQYCWPHQEKRAVCYLIHWLCSWQPHWPPDIPRKPGTSVHWWCYSYVDLLLCVHWPHGGLLGIVCVSKSWCCCANSYNW
jgi:MFS family permease